MAAERRTWRSRARRLLRPAAYVLGFVLVPLVVGVVTFALKVRSTMLTEPPPALTQAPPAPPAAEPGKLNAVILLSNRSTESTDFLAPYAVLAASGAFNVHAVAPERRVSPLFPGTLDILPHYSFAEYEQAVGSAPDLIVVPFVPDAAEQEGPLLAWIREQVGERTTVLTICGGSMVLAETGLLEGRRATSHQSVLRVVRSSHPEVHWVSGQRYVEDGNIISSAGITSGIDATLFALQRMLGREAADAAARKVGYPYTRYLDDPTFALPPSYGAGAYLSAGYLWGRTHVGMVLYEGVGEIELASIIDTYPRSLAAQLVTLAPERRVIRTQYGLDLVPRLALRDAPELDRVLIPGTPAGAMPEVEAWAAARQQPVQRVHGNGFAYDATLRDMVRHENAAIAVATAKDLEYPAGYQEIESEVPLGLVARPFALGLLGLGLVVAVDSRRRARRRS